MFHRFSSPMGPPFSSDPYLGIVTVALLRDNRGGLPSGNAPPGGRSHPRGNPLISPSLGVKKVWSLLCLELLQRDRDRLGTRV